MGHMIRTTVKRRFRRFQLRELNDKEDKDIRIRTIWRIGGCNTRCSIESDPHTSLKKRAPEKAGKKRGKRERLTRRGYLRALCKRDVGPRDLLLLGGAKEKQYT